MLQHDPSPFRFSNGLDEYAFRVRDSPVSTLNWRCAVIRWLAIDKKLTVLYVPERVQVDPTLVIRPGTRTDPQPSIVRDQTMFPTQTYISLDGNSSFLSKVDGRRFNYTGVAGRIRCQETPRSGAISNLDMISVTRSGTVQVLVPGVTTELAKAECAANANSSKLTNYQVADPWLILLFEQCNRYQNRVLAENRWQLHA
jgi:hypothetical protein